VWITADSAFLRLERPRGLKPSGIGKLILELVLDPDNTNA
jgi:hypothetical protein